RRRRLAARPFDAQPERVQAQGGRQFDMVGVVRPEADPFVRLPRLLGRITYPIGVLRPIWRVEPSSLAIGRIGNAEEEVAWSESPLEVEVQLQPHVGIFPGSVRRG